MLKDAFNSIYLNVFERITSPLLGTFIVAWSILNYDIYIILFSSWPAIDTIKHIDNRFAVEYWRSLLFPVIFTLVYLYGYPIPSRWVFKWWTEQKQAIKEIRTRIEDETPLTREEYQKARRDFYELKNEFSKLMEESEKNEKELRSLLSIELDKNKELNNQIILQTEKQNRTSQSAQSEIDPLAEYSKDKIELLHKVLMASSGESTTLPSLSTSLHLSNNAVKALLGTLELHGLIESSPTNRDHKRISTKGSSYMVKHGLV